MWLQSTKHAALEVSRYNCNMIHLNGLTNGKSHWNQTNSSINCLFCHNFQITLQYPAQHNLKMLKTIESSCPNEFTVKTVYSSTCTVTDSVKFCEYEYLCFQQFCNIFLLRDADGGTNINVCNITIT